MLRWGVKVTWGEAIRGAGGEGNCAERETEVRQRLPTCVIQSRDKSVSMQRSRKTTHSGSMIQQENERRSHFKPESHNSRPLLAVWCSAHSETWPILCMTLKHHDSSYRNSTLITGVVKTQVRTISETNPADLLPGWNVVFKHFKMIVSPYNDFTQLVGAAYKRGSAPLLVAV